MESLLNLKDDYKYDIAISFLAKDEALATQLVDQFQGRLRAFLYSRQQEKLAGTDGEKTFNEVFSKESRLVVVLYRSEWGSTAWTRIEETAIRNRAYEQGYDFVIFIPLDDTPSVPKWLPKTRLWVGLKRWGIPGAASVIDARFQELGGVPVEETIAHRAARLERESAFTAFRKRYLASEEGVRRARVAFESTASEIENRLSSLQDSAPTLGISIKREDNVLILISSGLALRVSWHNRFSNTLDESKLEITLWREHPPCNSVRYYDEPHPVSTRSLRPDVLPSEQACWIAQWDGERTPLLPDSAAETILNWWLERAIGDQKSSR